MSVTVETKGAESQVQSFSQRLLDAVKSSESLNKAINAVQAGFGKVGSAIGGAKSVFAGLEQGAGKAEDSIDKLKNTIKELGFSIEKGRLKNAKGDFVTLGDGAENASEDVKKLVKELEQLGYKVNSAGKITDLSGKFVKLGNDAEEAAKKQKDLADSFEKVALAAGVGFTAMSGVIGLSVKQSMELETAMAGLTKVVDFDTPDGLLNMRREFEKLSTEIPVSTSQLFEMAAAGGQLGVPAEKLKEFTVLTAQMATAFDMSADVAGDSMAKLANIFGKPIETMGEFGDMINTVSNNMPAKASEIVESLSRIGGSAKAFGLAEQEAVALAGSMISLGKAPEVASTAINSMITTLSTLDTKDQDVAQSLKAMGLNAEEFGRTIKEDGYKAIMQLLDGINQLPKDQQIGMVTDLFGKNFGDDILQLAGAPEVLEKINGLLAEQGNYIGSMAKEAANVSGTSASQAQMFANALENASAAFGDSFKPAISAAQEALTPLLEGFTKFAQDNPNLVAGIAAIVTGALGLVAGLGAVMAILPTMAAGWALLSAGMAAVSLPILGIVAGIAAVIAIGVLLYKNWDTIKAKASEIWNGIKETVSNAWESIKSLFSGDGFSGIWDGIKESASVAWVMIKHIVSVAWDNIKAYFTGSGDFLSSVWESVKSGVSSAWDSIKQAIVNKFNEIKQAFFEWLGGQPAPVQEMVSNIISIFTGLVGGIGAVWDLISSGASTAWEGIKSIASGAIDFISNAWNGIKDGASSAWESVKSTASSAFDTVKGYASEKLGQAKTVVSNIASDIGTAWDKAKDGASKAFDSVKSTINDKLSNAKSEAVKAMEAVKSAIASSGIGDAFSKGFDGAKNAVSSSMNGIRTVVTAGITAVKAMIQLNVTTFAIVFNTVFNSIKTIVQTAFGVIKGIVTGDIGAVKSAIQNGLSQLAGIARNAITQMVSAFRSAGSQLRNVGGDIIQGLINGLKAKAAAAVSAAREVASSAVSAFKSVFRTASPSRVTREIGEWVSEGLGIGIDAKAKQAVESAEKLAKATVTAINKPLNAKDAKKQAEKEAKEQQKEREKEQKKAIKQLEDYKKALSDAEQALERDLFILSQKSLGNPFAELTADIKFGKYGTNDTAKLQQLTQEKLYSENTLKVNEELKKVKDDIAKVGMTTSELMAWEYANSEKYLGVSKELFDELVQQTELLENKQRIYASEKKLTDEILKLDEQILLAGKNEFEILQYQLTYAKEYQGVNEDIKNTYLERVKAAKQEADLVKSRQSLEKAVAIAKNPTDKYAGMRYDLQQQGYDDATINEMVGNQEKTDVATAFNDLRNQMGQTNDPFAKLEAENQRKLEIIQKARGLELAKHAEFDEMEKQQHAEYLRAKNELTLTQSEQVLGSLTSIAKDAFGEQSKAYKIMFAMEKGMAIARSIMAIQTALASASASAPFPANLGVMATVAAQTASIIGNIKAVTMPVGQAHDGIMSVPKSGTWNLEKGERVLPKHTAKALDDKLDGMGSGVNITINVASDGSSTTDAQGANQTAKVMADKIKAVVLETLRQERKQGGLLYA